VELREASYHANIAAVILVGRIGTAAVYRTDLKAAVHLRDVTDGGDKIFPLALAADRVESWKREGFSVGFTNGCFDLVHAGHLALLADAKSRCDRLIVAVNADASVRRLKGETRPINTEMDRAFLLAELRSVDMVVIFREDTPEETLRMLRPDVLMKGGDYALEQIVGRDLVEAYGGRVERIPLREGYSTTNTIKRAQGGGA
jgi:D-beta-D-heptose 7-phosphate kinase/D-beta-D-heptose 1-phosphate adenosyltransferase